MDIQINDFIKFRYDKTTNSVSRVYTITPLYYLVRYPPGFAVPIDDVIKRINKFRIGDYVTDGVKKYCVIDFRYKWDTIEYFLSDVNTWILEDVLLSEDVLEGVNL